MKGGFRNSGGGGGGGGGGVNDMCAPAIICSQEHKVKPIGSMAE